MMRTSERTRLIELLRGGASAVAYTPHLALLSVAPDADGALTEVADANYARQPITFAASFGTVDQRTVQNSASVVFPVLAGNVTIWGYAIMDALVAGEARHFLALGSSFVLMAGETLRFQPNAIQVVYK